MWIDHRLHPGPAGDQPLDLRRKLVQGYPVADDPAYIDGIRRKQVKGRPESLLERERTDNM